MNSPPDGSLFACHCEERSDEAIQHFINGAKRARGFQMDHHVVMTIIS